MQYFPYTQPERNIYFNVALALLVMRYLGVTKKGKLLLNDERLMLMVFLLKNPLVSTDLLTELGYESALLEQSESFSVRSIAPNLDELLDRRLNKTILMFLAGKNMLSISYRKSDGIMYMLTEIGCEVADGLTGVFFKRAMSRLDALSNLSSVPTRILYQQVHKIIGKK